MTGDELILQLGDAIGLLKKALSNLNAVPNHTYCENYETCSEIEKFLSQFKFKDEDKAAI